MTASRWVDVRSALRESIGGRLELRLHDPMESAINRRAAENVAKGIPGRGMTADSLHFQTAMPRIDGGADASGMQPALEDLVAQVAAAWAGSGARPVLVLPHEIGLKDLPGVTARDKGGVPIGLSERDLDVVWLDLVGSDPHFLVFGDGESGKTNVLRSFLLGLMARQSPSQAQILLVDYRRTLLGVVPPEYLLGYADAEPASVANRRRYLGANASTPRPTATVMALPLSSLRPCGGSEPRTTRVITCTRLIDPPNIALIAAALIVIAGVGLANPTQLSVPKSIPG